MSASTGAKINARRGTVLLTRARAPSAVESLPKAAVPKCFDKIICHACSPKVPQAPPYRGLRPRSNRLARSRIRRYGRRAICIEWIKSVPDRDERGFCIIDVAWRDATSCKKCAMVHAGYFFGPTLCASTHQRRLPVHETPLSSRERVHAFVSRMHVRFRSRVCSVPAQFHTAPNSGEAVRIGGARSERRIYRSKSRCFTVRCLWREVERQRRFKNQAVRNAEASDRTMVKHPHRRKP